MRIVPALWELWDGKRYVGHVERPYDGGKEWEATASDTAHTIGRFDTKHAAIAALKRHDRLANAKTKKPRK